MVLDNKKYNISITLYNRYKSFILEYINNGFIASRAYAKAYQRNVDKTAEVEGCSLLRKPSVVGILCDELAKSGIDYSVEYIYEKVNSLINDKKTKKSDVLRALELIARIKGYMKPDSTQSIAVFQGIESKEKAIVKDRLTQPVGRQEDSKQGNT